MNIWRIHHPDVLVEPEKTERYGNDKHVHRLLNVFGKLWTENALLRLPLPLRDRHKSGKKWLLRQFKRSQSNFFLHLSDWWLLISVFRVSGFRQLLHTSPSRWHYTTWNKFVSWNTFQYYYFISISTILIFMFYFIISIIFRSQSVHL